MKKKSVFGAIAVLTVIAMTSLLAAGCATGYKAIGTYQNTSVPREEHARLFVGMQIQVVGVDGQMSPLKYIASGGNVILLAPGEHSINVSYFDGNRDQPAYPGQRLTFTVEAGKIYVVSTDATRSSRTFRFFLRELDNIPDDEALMSKGFLTDKETLVTQVEEAVGKL